MARPDPDLTENVHLRVLVLADTHLRCGASRRLSRATWRLAEEADVILHAGEVVEACLLDELARHAPTHAVLGNNDTLLTDDLPEVRTLVLAGVRITMIHDSGPSARRAERLARRFPDAQVIVFGHSHVPWNGPGVGGQLLFNPGSATQRRRQPHHTAGILDLAGGRVHAAEVVVVD
jgi:putative phosphoesterase